MSAFCVAACCAKNGVASKTEVPRQACFHPRKIDKPANKNAATPSANNQRIVITLTSSTKKPLLVFLGAAIALALVSLIGVLVGEALTRVVPVNVNKKAASLAFIIIGILMFFNKM